MSRAKIHLWVPCHALTRPENSLCLIAAHADLRRRGYDVYAVYHLQESMLSRGRNTIAAKFLASKADWLVTIDTDIVYGATDVAALLDHGRPAVAGNYRRKPTKPGEAPRMQGEIELDGPLARASLLPLGFCAVHREVFERILAHKQADPDFPLDVYGPEHQPTWGFFIPYIEDHRYLADDGSFSNRCRKAGIDLWIDTTLKLGHIGKAIY